MTPGKALALSAEIVHGPYGYVITNAEIRAEGEAVCNAEISVPGRRIPIQIPRECGKVASDIAFPMEPLADG